MKYIFILSSLSYHISAEKYKILKWREERGTNKPNYVVKLGNVMFDYNFYFMKNINLHFLFLQPPFYGKKNQQQKAKEMKQKE